jgi:hypothetical protein
VARRIDIELTSARPDGTWTWRAAGAMQPRGVVDGQLLHPGAKAGDVLRAEADFEIEGISIVSVLAPKEKKRAEPERIELIAPAVPTGVTTQLVGRGDRRPSDRRRDRDDGDSRGGRGRPGGGDRPSHRDGPGGGRPDGRRSGPGEGGRPARGGGDRPQTDRPQTDRPQGDRPQGDRPRSDRPQGDRGPGGRTGEGRPGEQDRRRREPSGRGGEGRPARTRPERGAGGGSDEAGSRAGARRLNPGNVHRQAVLASLAPEQQPIAEQVLRGGIPAVRTALHIEREKAVAEGRSAPNSDSLLAMAEELLPRLKAAEWRDRAEAAVKSADDLALRDLRSVVAGADLARDDETRQLAVGLREMLETRLTNMREEWVRDITTQLDEGRVVRALRLASRAPEATTRLSAEQTRRLTDAAGAAMSPDTAPDRWLALLEAVAASPVRRDVTPAGLPPEPGAALLTAAQQQVGRIPALATLLGITMPPPPGPSRPGNRPAAPGRRGPAVPPPPRRASSPAPAVTEAPAVPDVTAPPEAVAETNASAEAVTDAAREPAGTPPEPEAGPETSAPSGASAPEAEEDVEAVTEVEESESDAVPAPSAAATPPSD